MTAPANIAKAKELYDLALKAGDAGTYRGMAQLSMASMALAGIAQAEALQQIADLLAVIHVR